MNLLEKSFEQRKNISKNFEIKSLYQSLIKNADKKMAFYVLDLMHNVVFFKLVDYDLNNLVKLEEDILNIIPELKARNVVIVQKQFGKKPPFPSIAEITQTQTLHHKLRKNGISLLDHIIYYKNNHFSFAHYGYIQEMESDYFFINYFMQQKNIKN